MWLLKVFSKIFLPKDSENLLLGKLLMVYTSSVAPPPLSISLGLLMFWIVAHVQAATPYRKELKYYLLKHLLTKKNMRKRVNFIKNQNTYT